MLFHVVQLITAGFVSLCLFLQSAVTTGGENESGVVTVVVPEGSDTILPCSLSTKENLELKLFDWKKDGQKEVFLYAARDEYNNGRPGQDEQFRRRVSHFPDQLRIGNASILIRNTTLLDSGEYTCDFPLLQPEGQTFKIKLVVELTIKDRSGETPGAAPKPEIRTPNTTEGGVLLECEVPGVSPKPKVEWQDSDGNLLPAEEPQVSYRGDRYYITLLTTVTRTTTDFFHCVATQEELSHKVDAQIYLHYQTLTEVKSCSPGAGPWTAGMCIGAVAALFFYKIISTIKYHIHKTSQRKQRADPKDLCKDDTELPLGSQTV